MHEFGHFIIAKLCKIRVNEFAIGFGPTIFKKQGKETKYALRIFPLGGFVSMEGEDEDSDDERSFSKASIKKRLAVVFGGPIINILIALIIFFVIASFFTDKYGTEIDKFVENYSAESSDLKIGDRIIKVNNKDVNFATDVSAIVDASNGKEVNLRIKRQEEELDLNILPTDISYGEVGLYFSDENSTKVISIEKDSAGEKAGISVGDIITKINDIEVKNSLEKLRNTVNDLYDENIREYILFLLHKAFFPAYE